MDLAEAHQLHAFFFPFMAQGHLIPFVDMARLFSSHGVKVTIITTPLNARLFSNTIDRGKQLGLDISILLIPFPSEEAGLPQGYENAGSFTNFPAVASKFFDALSLFQQPFEDLLKEYRPDRIVADMFFPWVTDVSQSLGYLVSYFMELVSSSLCVSDNRYLCCFGSSRSDRVDEVSALDSLKKPTHFGKMMERIRESEGRSFGILVNSFNELEPTYADHYRKVVGRKAWHIGPVSLSNMDIADKAERGNKASIDEHVLNDEEAEQRRIIEEFEKKMEGRGLIIRDWAPQILFLDHPAVGGFVTHCGWNSTLESISAGVPMITWPLFAEQFHNEKLVTQVLKVGLSVGAMEFQRVGGEKEVVKRDNIKKTVEQLMGSGEEAELMRSRVRELKKMAERALEEGGSSYADVTTLIEELRQLPWPAI
ncbi:hypothetical protein NE237_023171 [Protea cynaroides]|uniref:Glycosyltransferase N-terminal domain-containing protein n=1 Tax=Protea cynaroides TaxID=273540 RepID=A0A9Q0HB81_9MAGN|nr:hypothetical protein NE237_023171 [Protea cynaroides]